MSGFGPSPFGQVGRTPLNYGISEEASILARFFNAVYAWMFAGLALTAGVAWWVGIHPSYIAHMGVGTWIILLIAEVGLVFVISGAINKINATAATGLFLVYAALNGLTLSVIFLVYAHGTLIAAFVAAAAMFGAMSLWGMVTKKDLSQLGGLLFGALIGIVVASLVNMFLHSQFLDWIVSYVGVAVFLGLTAYDTQRLKDVAYATASNHAMAARMSIVGALMLYLDFINLFIFMLRIMGNRRN